MPEDEQEEIFSASTEEGPYVWFSLEPFDMVVWPVPRSLASKAIVLDTQTGKYTHAYWSSETLNACEAEEAFQWLVTP